MHYDVAVTDDNLSAHPEQYPGRAVPGPGLLRDGRFVAMADLGDLKAGLRAGGLADLSGRTAVLAIGSNACAAVVLRKLESVGVDASVPFISGRAPGIAVGHSAHRSVAGFIPAAPHLRPGALNMFIVNMFGDEQLAAIDGTEPNYRRITVDCALPDRRTAELYVSRWGVIAPPGRAVLPLMAQQDLFGRLTQECQGFQEIMEASGRTAGLLAEQGWARDAGLG